jgi:hypothetical protein
MEKFYWLRLTFNSLSKSLGGKDLASLTYQILALCGRAVCEKISHTPAPQCVSNCDFRCGSKAPFWPSVGHFRSTPMSGHSRCPSACLKGATMKCVAGLRVASGDKRRTVRLSLLALRTVPVRCATNRWLARIGIAVIGGVGGGRICRLGRSSVSQILKVILHAPGAVHDTALDWAGASALRDRRNSRSQQRCSEDGLDRNLGAHDGRPPV